jgi:hypothetical protein
MTQKQPKALRLADSLDSGADYATEKARTIWLYKLQLEVAAELRRLHEVNAELLEALNLEMADEWECNSYHPKLMAAIAKAEEGAA